MQLAPNLFLTYCTNIHPANGWAAVREQLEHYAPPLKAALAPDAPFGIGLRLSGEESRQLLQEDHLDRFKAYLNETGLMVFTMNGFPHGPFHDQPVKDQVHAPDWRDPERVRYTLRLIEILAALLPDGMEGGISTSPLSYKPWLGPNVKTDTWTLLTQHVVEVAAALARVREQQGRFIHLDIEPEPDGLLETSTELVDFFEDWLLPVGGPMLAAELGVTEDEARAFLFDHIQVCWDTCHVAVAYESPKEVLARYTAHGIRVGKIQISSALKVFLPDEPTARAPLAAALKPFVESTYLHQVVQQNRNGTLHPYPDLDVALLSLHDPDAVQWRIHFHVPVFIQRYGLYESTQDGILDTFKLLREREFTKHLEIETYTWNVLPHQLRRPLGESIRREFDWVLNEQ